jgi:hypothetical protein
MTKPPPWDDPTHLDPVFFTKSEQRQLQRLMRRLGMTVWEVLSMAREQVLSEIDPQPGDGERSNSTARTSPAPTTSARPMCPGPLTTWT